MILVLCLRAGERIISIHEFIFGFAGPNIQPAAQPSFPGPSETDLEDLWGRYSLLVLSPLLFIPSPSCTHDSGELEHEPLALFWWDRSACTYVPSTSPELVPNDAVCLDMCLVAGRAWHADRQTHVCLPHANYSSAHWLCISLLHALGIAVTQLVHHSQNFSALMEVLSVLLVNSICPDIWPWLNCLPSPPLQQQNKAKGEDLLLEF